MGQAGLELPTDPEACNKTTATLKVPGLRLGLAMIITLMTQASQLRENSTFQRLRIVELIRIITEDNRPYSQTRQVNLGLIQTSL